MSLSHVLRPVAFLLAAFTVARAAEPVPGRADAAGPVGEDAEAREVLDRLLESKALRLSTGKDSASDRFELALTLRLPAKDGRTYGSRYVVARDKDAVAALVLSLRGEPFAYATAGLLAGFDVTDPGSLVLCDEGAPKFVLSLNEDKENLDLELSFRKSAEAPEVTFDPEALLRGARKKATRVSYDREERLIRLETPKTVVVLALSPAEQGQGFGLRALTVKSKAGLSLSLAVRTGGERSAILGFDRAAFERLGLPARTLGGKDVPKISLLVPPTFGNSEKERRAIDRVRELFTKPRDPSPGRPGAPGGEGGGEKDRAPAGASAEGPTAEYDRASLRRLSPCHKTQSCCGGIHPPRVTSPFLFSRSHT